MTGGYNIPKLKKGEKPRKSITQMEYDKSVDCIHEKEITILGDIFILCKLRFPFNIRCTPNNCKEREIK